METYEEIRKENKVLKIFVDENPDNPREWDNLGKFVLSHKRYKLPNELNINFENFESWEEIEKYLKKELNALIVLSVCGYEHSGFYISLNSNYPFNDYWDSGSLGFVCVLKEDIKKEFGKVTKQNIKKAEKVLINEFETYKNYLEGNVYGFELWKIEEVKTTRQYPNGKKKVFKTEEETELIDSCWGFFGDDGIKQIKEENDF